MKINILGTIWELRHENQQTMLKNHEEKTGEKMLYIFGESERTQHIIYISDELCKDQKIATFAHELMHAYLWVAGIVFENYSEENVCDLVAGAYETIKSNMEEYKKYLAKEK